MELEYFITDIVDTISFPSFFLSLESFYSKRTVFFWYFPNWKIKLSHIFHVSKLIHVTHEVFPNTLIFPKFYCKMVSQTFISLKNFHHFIPPKRNIQRDKLSTRKIKLRKNTLNPINCKSIYQSSKQNESTPAILNNP